MFESRDYSAIHVPITEIMFINSHEAEVWRSNPIEAIDGDCAETKAQQSHYYEPNKKRWRYLYVISDGTGVFCQYTHVPIARRASSSPHPVIKGCVPPDLKSSLWPPRRNRLPRLMDLTTGVRV